MKALLMTAAAAAMLTMGSASAQIATQPGAYGPVPAASVPAPAQRATRPSRSYGVGYSGRASATGGPVGGYPSRN